MTAAGTTSSTPTRTPARRSTSRKRRRGEVENTDYAAFAARVIRAHSRRIAEGDVEGLADLLNCVRSSTPPPRPPSPGCAGSGTRGLRSPPGSAPPGRPPSSAGARSDRAGHAPRRASCRRPAGGARAAPAGGAVRRAGLCRLRPPAGQPLRAAALRARPRVLRLHGVPAVPPETKVQLIRAALSGKHIQSWLPGRDHRQARSEAVASMSGGDWGQIQRQGIRSRAGDLITWAEVADVIERGCRRPGLRAAYEDAYRDWCGWAKAGGYSPDDEDWTDQQRDDHDAWYRRASRAIRETTAMIIAAGCITDYEQEALF